MVRLPRLGLLAVLGTVLLAAFCNRLLAEPGAARPASARPASVALPSGDSRVCLRCHGLPDFAFREKAGARPRQLTVAIDSFAYGPHARIACTSCHPTISSYPHALGPARRQVGCGDDCHATDSAGRPRSHRQVLAALDSSAHRRGLDRSNPEAPTCTTCHGTNLPAPRRLGSGLAHGERIAMCARCHDDEQMMLRNRLATNTVESYRRSYHWKAIRFGDTATAACQDCHDPHRALPADSAASSVAPAHLSRTCGQAACHPGAALNFAMSGANHLDLRIDREPVLQVEETFFQVLTAGTMAMLAVGIALDVLRKVVRRRARTDERVSGDSQQT